MPTSREKQIYYSDAFALETNPVQWSGVTDRRELLEHVERLLSGFLTD